MAGAPFFFGEADGVALDLGVSLGLGDADSDSSGDGVGVGELLRFFFLLDGLAEDSGDGLGEAFFFFADGDGLELDVAEGVGLAVAFFFGDGDFSGDAVGLGVGDFSAIDFFFGCFRGVGVGVGAKIFFSLVPNDSSAGALNVKPPSRTQKISTVLTARIGSGNVASMDRKKSCHPEPPRRRGTPQLQLAIPRTKRRAPTEDARRFAEAIERL